MSNGNLQVYGTVLQLNSVFKLSDVINATGLSKQLVDYHLRKLVEKGILEKDENNRKYVLVARGDLIGELMSVGENKVTGLMPEKPPTLDKVKVNSLIKDSVLLTSAQLPGHLTLKSALNESLDLTVRELQSAKRYLNSKRINEDKAVKQVEQDLSRIWENVGKLLNTDKSEFEDRLVSKLTRVMSNENN